MVMSGSVDPDTVGWIQWAMGGMAALFTGVSWHQYSLGASRGKTLFNLIEKEKERSDSTYVRKDTLEATISSFKEAMVAATSAVTHAVSRQSEDHRIMVEKFDDLAREVHLMAGQMQQLLRDRDHPRT